MVLVKVAGECVREKRAGAPTKKAQFGNFFVEQHLRWPRERLYILTVLSVVYLWGWEGATAQRSAKKAGTHLGGDRHRKSERERVRDAVREREGDIERAKEKGGRGQIYRVNMEALTLLRQYTMARKKAKEDGNYYVFGHRKVPKDTPTAWKSAVGSEVSPAFICGFLVRHLGVT